MNEDKGVGWREPAEGWYLMSTPQLEEMLRRHRAGWRESVPPDARGLTIEEALAVRGAGNVPDQEGRSLRLLLLIEDQDAVRSLPEKRLQFEPDYLEAPTWRREGSMPVNIVPLGDAATQQDQGPWWEEPELAALESEWRASGAVSGVRLPSDFRGFVYKTILALRTAGREVTVETISNSLARWLLTPDAAAVRAALEDANRLPDASGR